MESTMDMTPRRLALSLLAAVLAISGCAAQIPSGPTIMVLPGSRRSFEEFQDDDRLCRDWADYQVGTTRAKAANDTVAASAAIGTVVGAAAGAAIGAAAGDPATGAAVGAGVGLLGGAAGGADRADEAEWSVQRRYDAAYTQCMYAKGHQVPIPRGSHARVTQGRPPPYPVGPRREGRPIPPPPPGKPPPPPPDVDGSLADEE